MEATDNADIVVAVLSLLKLNFKEAKQNFARWRQLNERKKNQLLLIWIHSVDSMTLRLITPLYSVKQMKAYDCIYLSTQL